MLSRTKKGVSPLIATVLIIGMVVAASIIVFLWGKGYEEQLIEKGGSLALSTLDCATDIEIDVLRHDATTLTIENKGRGRIDGLTLVEDGTPREEGIAIEPGSIQEVQYSGQKIVIVPKIRIAKGVSQPCSEQKITYSI